MFKLAGTELYRIFRKPRTYISFIAIMVIVVLIQIGFYAEGESYMGFGIQAISESFIV